MASTSGTQEFSVRVPNAPKKKYSILKFNPANNVDFTKSTKVAMERENNLRDFKAAHNIDQMPKEGGGSEFGRDQREEARRKKYGVYLKNYSVDDQAWVMKIGSGKEERRFRGLKQGGTQENASYFVFTQHADGAFEALPVEEWYNFTPVAKYKKLNAEEAEEMFKERDKVLNHFTLMLQKKINPEGRGDDEDGSKEEKKNKKKSKDKEFFLSDMDEWAILSDDEKDDDEDDEREKDSDEEKGDKKKKGDKGKKKRSVKLNDDEEALEESDEADEANEIDYMTDSNSSEEEMPYEDKDRDNNEKYQQEGVEQEDALKQMIDSGDEEEEEQQKEGEEQEEEEELNKSKGSGSGSGSSSDSDSDLDKEENIKSALLLQKKPTSDASEGGKKDKKGKKRRLSGSSEGSAARSRSNTPVVAAASAEARSSPLIDKHSKKIKLEPKAESSKPESQKAPMPEGLNEETVRRYLMRKSMTTKDLIHKFRHLQLTKDQLVASIADILKKVDPKKTKIGNKLYLHIDTKNGAGN